MKKGSSIEASQGTLGRWRQHEPNELQSQVLFYESLTKCPTLGWAVFKRVLALKLKENKTEGVGCCLPSPPDSASLTTDRAALSYFGRSGSGA